MTKYLVRASVAIPFLFALAFGLAAVTVILINEFGYRDAYFILAGGFAALGVLGAIAVWLKERADESEEADALDSATKARLASSAVETARQMPAALAGSTSEASSGLRDFAKSAARNWPLLVAGAVAVLILGGSSGHRYGRYRR